MPISNVGVGLQKALVLTANHFVRKMEERIRQNNLPRIIIDKTSIGTPVQSGNATYIDVTIDISKESGAPMAAAFEYGSGIHSERGTREKYPIVPVDASVLAISRDRWRNYNPPPDVDPIFLNRVLHPGVAARPYIRPTLLEERQRIKDILKKEFIASIRLGGITEIIS